MALILGSESGQLKLNSPTGGKQKTALHDFNFDRKNLSRNKLQPFHAQVKDEGGN